jgi:hypothetical protein
MKREKVRRVKKVLRIKMKSKVSFNRSSII